MNVRRMPRAPPNRPTSNAAWGGATPGRTGTLRHRAARPGRTRARRSRLPGELDKPSRVDQRVERASAASTIPEAWAQRSAGCPTRGSRRRATCTRGVLGRLGAEALPRFRCIGPLNADVTKARSSEQQIACLDVSSGSRSAKGRHRCSPTSKISPSSKRQNWRKPASRAGASISSGRSISTWRRPSS